MMIRKYLWLPLLVSLVFISYELTNSLPEVPSIVESFSDSLQSLFKPSLTYAKKDYYTNEENLEELKKNLYVAINVIRMNHGVNKLVRDEKLELAAQRHANDMVERDYLSHYSPEGTSVFDRLKEVGYNYYQAGENIFEANRLQYLDPMNMTKVVIEGWMNSKKHRENLLHPAYEEVGIGVAYDPEKKRLVVVADFGSELGG